jgi:cobalt-zinc-cadmium efflux system membrane fusion protein
MSRRVIALASILLALSVGAVVLVPVLLPGLQFSAVADLWRRKETRAAAPVPPKPVLAQLVSGLPDTLSVPPEVVDSLGLRTSLASPPSQARSLTLSGSLAIDSNLLAHVHTRFAGEVVELGTVQEMSEGTDGGRVKVRPISFGDQVKKGQLLAVLWSSDLGERKSDYVDALSKLRVERETLKRLETLLREQSIPERTVREARRTVESAAIAVERVERVLRSWRLTDEEIAAVRAEADPAVAKKEGERGERERSWARVALYAPLSGTVLEKNLAVGDIVDTATDLFKIADLHDLSVWAHVYEEDLPQLLALPTPVRWTLRLKADPDSPPLPSVIERIGSIIDPNQHTALVTGHVENRDGRLRAGQFIVATVELPAAAGELEIPTSALIEDGDESVIFVQPEPSRPEYSLRPVSIVRHSRDVASVRANPGAGGESPGPLRPGDRIVSSGALLLRAALKDLKAAAKAEQ